MGSTMLIQYLAAHGAKLDLTNRLGQNPYYITQGVYQAGSFFVRQGSRRTVARARRGYYAWRGSETHGPGGLLT